MSMFAGDAGTLSAVLFGRKCRKWDGLAGQLQEAILLLTVEKRILESRAGSSGGPVTG
jgi:hypothetical protein